MPVDTAVANRSAKLKSALVLLGTFALGVLVGALLLGTLVRGRMDVLRALRTEEGFVERMTEIIEPEDQAQRAAIRPTLERAAADVKGELRQARAGLAATMDTMRTGLAPYLTEAQLRRLDAEQARFQRLHPPQRRATSRAP